MFKWQKRKKIYLFCLALLFLIWLNNTSLFFSNKDGKEYKILAHRGLAQTFDESKADWDSNTAAMIAPPHIPILRNTISSMQAAFDLGSRCSGV